MRAVFRTKQSRKRGFTLVEAIVSIGIFAIAAVMIAMILFTATNMVQMSLVYDSDREKLSEAAALSSSTRVDPDDPSSGLIVSLDVKVAGNDVVEKFVIDLTDGNTLVEVEGRYFEYTVQSTKRKYYIFVSD